MEKPLANIVAMPSPVLAIDVGACTLAAAVRDASGRVTPLLIVGTTTPLARLVVQAGQPRPAREGDPVTLAQIGPLVDRLDVLSLVIDGVSWSIEALTGLLLRPVLEAAIDELGTTPKIVIVVPSTWAPELQRRFQRIVHAALTRTVTLIPSDKALAYALPSLPVGAGIIAVDCGASDLAAIAVIGGERGPRIIGRAQSDSGGDIFDRFLLANALTDAGFPDQALDARWGFAGVPRVRAAREALADTDVATVRLPRPVGRITLSEQDVDATGAQYFARQFSDLLTRLDENATEPISHRLMLSGGLAYDPAVPAAARVHGPVKVMTHPQHVLCRGALAFDTAAVDSTDDPGPRPIAAIDDEDDEPVPGGISKRTLALFGGVGVSAVVIAVAGGLALSAAMTGAPDLREPDLPNVAASVLPGDQSITGASLRSWSDGVDTIDATTRSLAGTDVRSLACGGTRQAAGAEADGMRWQSSRIFVSDDTAADAGAGARATSWDSFDPSATTNVIVTASIVGRDDRESVWQDISASNQRCPSTKDDLVRTIVVIPQTGPDPGPPSYAQELPVASTSRTPATTPATTTRAPQGGVTMSTQRQAWRGLTPASVSGSGADMHVTCVLDIDGVVLKRSCATAEDSGTADHLAQQAAAAFNPAPEITR